MTLTKNYNGILKPEHLALGFSLREKDDHIVMLYLGTEPIAPFTNHCTAKEINYQVSEYCLVIRAFKTTDYFGDMASEYCRNEGWKEPA